MKKILFFALASAMIVSCGDKKKKAEENAAKQVVVETTTPEKAPEEKLPEGTIELLSTDQMTFNKSEIVVKAGQKVTLVLKHTGKMSKQVMGHNFVLLKSGVDVAKFATEAMKAADTDYIPKMTKDVIANTPMIGGGEQATITFDAPEVGTYDYICSFPGHYSIMKGKLIVE